MSCELLKPSMDPRDPRCDWMEALPRLKVELDTEEEVEADEGYSITEIRLMLCDPDDGAAREQCRIYWEIKEIGRNSGWCK